MAKPKPEKDVRFPQNDCVIFGQLAPFGTRVHVSTSQAGPSKNYDEPKPPQGKRV